MRHIEGRRHVSRRSASALLGRARLRDSERGRTAPKLADATFLNTAAQPFESERAKVEGRASFAPPFMRLRASVCECVRARARAPRKGESREGKRQPPTVFFFLRRVAVVR